MLMSISVILMTCGGVLLVINIVLLLLGCCWWRSKKRKEKERHLAEPEFVPLLRHPGPLVTTPVTCQTSIREFEIPHLDERETAVKEMAIQPKSVLGSGLDPFQYGGRKRVTLGNKPKLGFELYYDFRSTQLKVNLKGLKNVLKVIDEQIQVTILMSHTTVIYDSSKVSGPDAELSEEYPFPLDSMEISSDPPVTVKFNVWHIDKNARKIPYGYVQVEIEEILANKQNITSNKGKAVWRNIVLSDDLTDEGLKGELLVTLSYLSSSQRIGCTIAKAKGLILMATDKDLHAKITLLSRDVEQQSVVTNFTDLKQNPEFNQEFIFRFTDFRNATIDGIALRIDIIARQSGLLSQPRFLGRCIIGNSSNVERLGKEHWVTTLTSPKSVTQWHPLKDPTI